MAPRLVTVLGATGSQGGAVVAELLKRPADFQIRAITRDPTKPAAKLLSSQGVEVVGADLNAGHDVLVDAFAGSDVIFGLTNFWSTQSSETERQQGQCLVDAVAATDSLSHFMWSSLPDPVALSCGKYTHVDHWEAKNDVTDYIRTQYAELWAKTTTILFPNYFENCLTKPERYLPINISGTYVRSFPHSLGTILPNVSIADTGKLVRSVINHGRTYMGKTIAFYAQGLSESDKLAILGRALDIPTLYKQLSSEEFQQRLIKSSTMKPRVALDYAEQLLIFEDFGNVYAREEFVQAAEIPGLSLTSWEEFIERHDLFSKIQEGTARARANA